MDIMKGLYLYPLQTYQMSDFWKPKSSSNTGAILFLIGIAIVIIILIIVNVLKKKYNVPALTGGVSTPASTPTPVRRYSSFALHRLANNMGLNKPQIKMLDFVFKSEGVTNVEQAISSTTVLDQHFKRAYHAIERTATNEAEAQEKMAILFSTRNVLEANSSGGSVSSTRQVPDNSAAVLGVEQEKYPVRVLSAKGEHLLVENPQNSLGTAVKLAKGAKVNLAFFTKSSTGFSFETRVLETAEGKNGLVLHLMHSSQIKRLSQRRFRRRQAVISTNFFFVYVEEGRKGEKKMVVDKRSLSGNILDLSIGGCSIKTNASVTSGTRLKIEYSQLDGTIVAVLGQVLRTNQSGRSAIMHIKFLRIPRKSMNAINAFVYEYAD